MDALSKSIHILSMIKLPRRNHIFETHLDFNPLGRVTFAAILPNWIGTGFSRFRRWGSYQVVLLLRGEGIYRDAEGRDFQVKKGDLFLTAPGVPHQYGPPPGRVWTEFVVGFSGSLFDVWNRAGILHPQAAPIPVPLELWYRKLRGIVTPTPRERREPIRHLIRLLSLLEDLPLDKPYTRTHNWPDWMGIALSMIEAQDLANPYPLEAIARSCGMGIHSFRRNFAQLTGHGPVAFQKKFRMETAHRLLATEKLSVKEIGQQLGFCNSFHFSAAFKKYSGLSPRAFRAGDRGEGDENGYVG
jgi:AraC-like DNA-binding protein